MAEAEQALSGGCTASSLTFDLPSPQAAGASITLTAQASCPAGKTLEVAFVRYSSNGGWGLIRGWGGPTYTWDTTDATANDYMIYAQVRSQGSPSYLEDYVGRPLTLTGGAATCTAASLSFDLASPQAVGTAITLSASATCTPGATPEYAFTRYSPGYGWALMQGWGGPTFTWDTTDMADEDHLLFVEARAQGNTTQETARAGAPYTLTGGPGACTAETMDTDLQSPESAGTAITLSASATCTQGASAEIQYLLWDPHDPSDTFQVIRDYGPATMTWDTQGLQPGGYLLGVCARRQGSMVDMDSWNILSFEIQ